MIYAIDKNLYIEDENKKINVGGSKSDGYFYPEKKTKRATPNNLSLKDKNAIPVFVENAKPHLIEVSLIKDDKILTVFYGLNPVKNSFEPLFIAQKNENEDIKQLDSLKGTEFYIEASNKYKFYDIQKIGILLSQTIKDIKKESLTGITKNPEFIKIFASVIKNSNEGKKDLTRFFEDAYFMNKIISLLKKEKDGDKFIKKIEEEGKKEGISESFLNDLISGNFHIKEIGDKQEDKSFVETLKEDIEQIQKRISELEETEDLSSVERIYNEEKIKYFKDKLQSKNNLLQKINGSIEQINKQNSNILTIYEIPTESFYVDIKNPDFLKFLEKNFFSGVNETNIYKITDDYINTLSAKNAVAMDQILYKHIKEEYFQDVKQNNRQAVNYEIVGKTLDGQMFYYKRRKYPPVTFYDKLNNIEEKEDEIKKNFDAVFNNLKEDKDSFENLLALSAVLMEMKNEIVPKIEKENLSKEDFKKQREEIIGNPEKIVQLKQLVSLIYKTAEVLQKNKVSFVKYSVLTAMLNESKAQNYYLNKKLTEETLNKVLMSIDKTLKGFAFALNTYKDFYGYKFDPKVFNFTKEGERVLGKSGVDIKYNEFKKLNYQIEHTAKEGKEVYEPVILFGTILNPSKEGTAKTLKYSFIPVIGVKPDLLLKDINNMSDDEFKQYIVSLKSASSSGINKITSLAYHLQKLDEKNFRRQRETILQLIEFLLEGKKKKDFNKLNEIDNIGDFKNKSLELIPELKEVFDLLPDLSFVVETGGIKPTDKIENIYEAKTISYVKNAITQIKNGADKLSFKKGFEQTPLKYIINGDFTYSAYSKKADENGKRKYLGKYMRFFIPDKFNDGDGRKGIFLNINISPEEIKEILNTYGYKKTYKKNEFKIDDNEELIKSLANMYILNADTANVKNSDGKAEEKDFAEENENPELEDLTEDNIEYVEAEEQNIIADIDEDEEIDDEEDLEMFNDDEEITLFAGIDNKKNPNSPKP